MISSTYRYPVGGPQEPPEEPGQPDRHGDLAVEEARPKLRRPPLYKVLMLNDDYTPMDFVVEVLERFFAMDREQATRTMLTVHTEGRAVCGVYPRDIAESKKMQVENLAREYEMPLRLSIEAEDDGKEEDSSW